MYDIYKVFAEYSRQGEIINEFIMPVVVMANQFTKEDEQKFIEQLKFDFKDFSKDEKLLNIKLEKSLSVSSIGEIEKIDIEKMEI